MVIGANGSGKSNLIEVLSMLLRLPRTDPAMGLDLLWKGGSARPSAHLVVDLDGPVPLKPLRYELSLESDSSRLVIGQERLDWLGEDRSGSSLMGLLMVSRDAPGAFLRRDDNGGQALLPKAAFNSDRSILGQIRDPATFPQLAHVTDYFGAITLYRSIPFGPDSVLRRPQPADLPNRHLREDGSNLALVLSKMRLAPGVREQFIYQIQKFYPDADSIEVLVEGNTAQVFLGESTGWTTPATRLSDGTMRWLCLLAILLHPEPPPLICIEEPEVGLHPDILPVLADLLVDASKRTQLIITTHSDILVDALQNDPERIVVCEKHEGSTTMRRLSKAELEPWLKEYSLGTLWRRGEFGGNRW